MVVFYLICQLKEHRREKNSFNFTYNSHEFLFCGFGRNTSGTS